ncbi:hypothetical protein CYLTODRAFT_491050 [Cylindrobasidium torrendii FP15055 ss-10]|uniref:C2 NT-type domain-containing protein n=1 Tax=Cylindrobasidium torrendii FP15055 ss-10 TaxID=1314674 RepID=A0A0D7B8S2_9AGAR|nr:hypothetical protein CYLTODRAFT_491050 [Cylindrobasidium torrendii FP15055 ss-10]
MHYRNERPPSPLAAVEPRSDSPAPHLKGIRAHLHHLLPRHALFHAQIEVHQISNVPLVNGEFSVRWKIKHTAAAPSKTNGLFKLTSKNSTASSNGSTTNLSLTRTRDSRESRDIQEQDDSASIASSLSPDDSFFVSSEDHGSSTVPTLVVSEDAQSSSSSSSSPRTSASHRGQTPFFPLQDHAVVWEHSISTYIKIPLSRDRATPDKLVSSLGKFVVIQHSDGEAPQNPRYGALYLDLSQYAGPDVGEVTRPYLLRDSKTNTTLKLTIKLTHVGGEKHFVAPPLPKAEILTGLAGLLEKDIYQNVPSKFDRFGKYVGDTDVDRADTDSDSHSSRRSAASTPMPLYAPFEVSQLPNPYAYGARTTDALIESLFNPIRLPASLKADGKLDPFVKYVPDREITAV